MLVITVLFFGGIGTGLYFVFRTEPVDHPTIKLDTPYFMRNMKLNLFRYLDEDGMPSQKADPVIFAHNPLVHGRPDHSFARFEDNWRVFRIRFMHPVEASFHKGEAVPHLDFVFVVTSISTGRGGFVANIRHIYDGHLVNYTVTTSNSRIILTAVSRYRVNIASNDWTPSPEIEVFRSNTVIMRFSFVRPSYIDPWVVP